MSLRQAPLLLLLVACATSRPAPPLPADPESLAPGARAAAEAIRPEAISAHIGFLADDLLEGRATGERGHRVAAAYVASQLAALGLEPAGVGGSWFQELTLRAGRPALALLEVGTTAGSNRAFALGQEFLAHPPLGTGVIDVTAPVVFVGHAIIAPEYHWDDLAGVEVRGKVALVLGGAPLGTGPDFFAPIPSAVYGQIRTKMELLRARGAVGVIMVHTPEREKVQPWARAQAAADLESMALVDGGRIASYEELPRLLLSSAGTDALLAAAGRPERVSDLVAAVSARKSQSFELGTQARIRVEGTLRTVTSVNVAGLWRAEAGSPLAGETVVYTAHLDHLGIGKPENGDAIYNGASDDAAGVSSLLEVAAAFTRLPSRPKRSVLFLLVTGEEKGLLGSEWFVDHPTVPAASLVADINADSGLAIYPPREMLTIGAEESTLNDDVRRAAAALGLGVGKDPEPRQGHAVRSDQYNFLRHGIPATTTGVGPGGATEAERKAAADFRRTHYHRVTDAWEPDRDYRPAATVARFQFLLGLSLAERPTRPTFLPDSFFLRPGGH